jgi:hypothetical protein
MTQMVNGFATRRPKRRVTGDRGFRPSLNPKLKLVNIRLFAVAMEKLADYLEGIKGWFAHLEGTKAERI